jgi:uncharacterized protein YjbI with pentapeptide repeats
MVRKTKTTAKPRQSPRKPAAAKSTPAKKAASPSVSSWIIREVSFATYRSQQENEARQITESLSLLEGGVQRWNKWRQTHPAFIPHLQNINLSWTNKHIESLEGIDLSNARLEDTDFEGMYLAKANLAGAKMSRVNLTDASLEQADLTGADLTIAHMTESHLALATFDHADLSGAILTDAELWEASLQGTSLRRAVLDGAEAPGIHAMGADFTYSRMLDADFTGADLSGADLSYATLVRSNFQRATLTGCNVYGISVWDADMAGAEQSGLIIAEDKDSPVFVDDIEVAQFVHLLLDHKKLRKVITAVAERGVLILGRFSHGGLEVLQALASQMRKLNYLPILFDFDRPADRNYTETVMTLAGISRFVIADLSGPSVPQELHATVPHFKIPFVPILKAGKKPYAMFADILEYPWVVQPVVQFKDEAHLQQIAKTHIATPAEAKLKARRHQLKALFPPSR